MDFRAIFRFWVVGWFLGFERSILGVKISKTRFKARVSKNHENLDFDIIPLKCTESSGEQPPTLRKMFCGRLGVEKSIFLNPDFGPTRYFDLK